MPEGRTRDVLHAPPGKSRAASCRPSRASEGTTFAAILSPAFFPCRSFQPMSQPLFQDRQDAGRALAEALRHHAGTPGTIVLALPRGGVPVGWEVARHLRAPLDVFLVRKLGAPGHEEYAIGAIAEGVRVLDDLAVRHLRIDPGTIEALTRAEREELERRQRLYRAGLPPLALAGRRVILVDDGLATGATMRAAVQAVRAQAPAWTCAAAPLGSTDACALLRADADEVVCVAQPHPFRAVGLWYREFEQTSDGEVLALLGQARARDPASLLPATPSDAPQGHAA
jgi:predicted phosphoribosyltransferase